MQVLSVKAFPISFSLFCFICCILQTIIAQSNSGPRVATGRSIRPHLRWENNGRVFSLFSQGSQYVPSGVRARESGPHSPVVVISDNNDTSEALSTSSIHAQTQKSPSSPRRPLVRTQGFNREATRSISPHGPGQGDRETLGDTERSTTAREDTMVGDDPYDPYKSLTNPYYNFYDAYFRPRPRTPEVESRGTNYVQHGNIFFHVKFCKRHSICVV